MNRVSVTKVKEVEKRPADTDASDYPPPEEQLGGGDICSLEQEPSTDDDKPLD
jgi:hypothetical protein